MKAIRSAAARRVAFTICVAADRFVADRVRFAGSLTHRWNDAASLPALSRLLQQGSRVVQCGQPPVERQKSGTALQHGGPGEGSGFKCRS